MKRNFSIVFAAVMMVAMIFVSCSAQGVNEPEDTISVHLGQIVAKVEGDGSVVYDRTAFDDQTKATDAWVQGVEVVDPDSLVWAYKATKADSLYDSGKTDGFVNLNGDNKGLEATLENMSRGSWTFELRGYNTLADRAADTNVVYKGKTTTKNLTENSQVDVPVTYAYGDAKSTDGAVEFDITVNYDQAVAGTANFDEYDLEVRVNLGTKDGAAADIFKLTRDEGVANTKEGYISKTYHYTSASKIGNSTLEGDIMRDQGLVNNGEVHFWLVKYGADGKTVESEEEITKAKLEGQQAVIMSGLVTKITATANVELAEGGKISIKLYTTTDATTIGQPDTSKLAEADYQATSTNSGTALGN